MTSCAIPNDLAVYRSIACNTADGAHLEAGGRQCRQAVVGGLALNQDAEQEVRCIGIDYERVSLEGYLEDTVDDRE